MSGIELNGSLKPQKLQRVANQPENHFATLIPHQQIVIVPSFTLESGIVLRNVPIAYTFQGELSPKGNNALVICHALTGSADVGDWWGPLMGEGGKAFDYTRFFVVCLNSLGSPYGSASPVTYKHGDSTQGQYGPEFPLTTIRDDVNIHKLVLEDLGVRQIAAVVGGSMGGMLVLEYAYFGKDFVRTIVPIATSSRHSAWCISWGEAQRQSIYCDPKYNDGYYFFKDPPNAGLGAARMSALLTYRSRDSFEGRFGRNTPDASRKQNISGSQQSPTPPNEHWAIHNDGHKTTGASRPASRQGFTETKASNGDVSEHNDPQFNGATSSGGTLVPGRKSAPTYFSAQSYLRYQGEKFVKRFDSNCYIAITRKLDTHDVSRHRVPPGTPNGVAIALSHITQPTLILGIESDGLFTFAEQQELAAAIPHSRLRTIDSPEGHDAFLLQFEQVNKHILDFFREVLPDIMDAPGIEVDGINGARRDGVGTMTKSSIFGEAEVEDITACPEVVPALLALNLNTKPTDYSDVSSTILKTSKDRSPYGQPYHVSFTLKNLKTLILEWQARRAEMTDYSKQTVVKLKDELKLRGLPGTGKKADLVARLEAHDVQESAVEEAAPSVTEAVAPAPTGAAPAIAAGNESQPPVNDPTNYVNTEGSATVVPEETESRNDTRAQATLLESPTTQLGVAEVLESHETSKGNSPEKLEAAQEGPPAETVEKAEDASTDTTVVTDSIPLDTQMTEPEEPVAEPSATTETMHTLNTQEEIAEDSRKRKRRSQSPPLSSFDTSIKKAKTQDGSPRVVLPEDIATPSDSQVNAVMEEPLTQPGTDVKADGESSKPKEALIDDIRPENDATKEMAEEGAVSNQGKEADEDQSNAETTRQASPRPAIAHDTKHSPTDTRFKGLFSAPGKLKESHNKSDTYVDTEDRAIPPAIHPATSALYIRNFSRPLNPGNLKEHLNNLATPAGASADPDTIVAFHLDTIRTHCLVQFSNVAGASRVRSGLHDRVWPDEKNRKPLWADFVPEEKLAKWIEIETEAAGGKGQPMKRWEVVYEEEDSTIMAYLQEGDGTSRNLQRSGVPTMSQDDIRRGIQGVPTGPRTAELRSQPRQPSRSDGGKGFKALDDLFQSTAAKPKLYYKPIDKAVADRRLDLLAAGRGNGRNDEMRRYTFEENTIVDRGPEFGYGRGGGRGRGGGGGYGGGYSDRGGGYRGDSWRSRR
ncbi:MAG: homoserine O- acetyltransferase [Icmadophila ericetorum]|nr:homoserine O- acetyltransferase [Icmadophila ericetorum]